jgi:ABC-2 type transport system ATP-binding protein
VLVVADICKSFGRHRVLTDIAFEVSRGQITGLLGPNGAGKSTLLHILVGLISPTSGTVFIDEGGTVTLDVASRIGFCADDLPMPDLLTGREYLDMVRGIRRLPRSREAEDRLLLGMRLTDASHRLIGTYSHGMKRKLQLVAALLHRPHFLVLDEPFRGLDPESSAIMKVLLQSYAKRGNAVLVSTHDLLVAEQLCSELVVLREGSVLATASVESLRVADAGASLEDSFLRMTGLLDSSVESSARFFEGLEMLSANRR